MPLLLRLVVLFVVGTLLASLFIGPLFAAFEAMTDCRIAVEGHGVLRVGVPTRGSGPLNLSRACVSND